MERCESYIKNKKVKWVHRLYTKGQRNINLCDFRVVGAEEKELLKTRCLRGEARRRKLVDFGVGQL